MRGGGKGEGKYVRWRSMKDCIAVCWGWLLVGWSRRKMMMAVVGEVEWRCWIRVRVWERAWGAVRSSGERRRRGRARWVWWSAEGMLRAMSCVPRWVSGLKLDFEGLVG